MLLHVSVARRYVHSANLVPIRRRQEGCSGNDDLVETSQHNVATPLQLAEKAEILMANGTMRCSCMQHRCLITAN